MQTCSAIWLVALPSILIGNLWQVQEAHRANRLSGLINLATLRYAYSRIADGASAGIVKFRSDLKMQRPPRDGAPELLTATKSVLIDNVPGVHIEGTFTVEALII